MKREGQKMPSFDGRVENWDKWEIKLGTLYQVQGLSDCMRDALVPNMSESSVSVIGKDAAGKLLKRRKRLPTWHWLLKI